MATEENFEMRSKKLNIDTGWAWVILVSSFMSLFLTCGALYSVGIFNVIFLEHFQESKAKTSLVGSVLIGLIALMGPVSSVLSNRYGWRLPMMLGGLIATCGTFLASMAQTLNHVMIFYGVIAGIGLGLSYTPAIVVVGYYFEKYRTIASGMASVGAGVGMMSFPPIIRLLSEYFSWREILAYISCLYAQLCVFGALMRPLDIETVSGIEYEKVNKNEPIKDDLVSKNANLIRRKKTSEYLSSTNSVDNIKQYIKGDNITNDKDPNEKDKKIAETIKPLMISNGLNAAHSLIHLEDISKNKESAFSNLSNLKPSKSLSALEEKQKDIDKNNNNDHSDDEDCYCSKIGLYYGTCCKYSCSCSNAAITNCGLPSIVTGEFIVFCISIFLFGIGLSALYLHLSAFAISSGASETEASFLITLLGISSIISRVFTGVAGNDNSIDNTILYIGAFGIAGISTMLCPVFGGTSKGRLIYALSFGFYGSCFNVLLAPLTVELIGLKNLSTAFGIEMVVNGVAYFIGPPLAGWLYDLTLSYNTSFFLAGVCLITSAVVMMLVSVFKRRDLPITVKDLCPSTPSKQPR